MKDKEHRNALQSGYRLHWYELRAIIGQGGFGITYLAEDTNLHRSVAIKEYLPSELVVRENDASVHPVSGELDEEYRLGLERFIIEARTLARFKHPNIVPVQAVFEENNTGYMVMNYERGQTLQERLTGKQTIPEQELLEILFPLLDGLEYIHAHGFIHRDLKPGNILVREDGTPVLLDFGSARHALGEKTRTLTSMVSPGYAPYEQYYSRSDEQGPWTDIYGMGATLYRAVTGVSPANALDRSKALLEVSRDVYISTRELAGANYSVHLLDAIDHAMCFRYQDRPQSIVEWRREFASPVATDTVTIRLLPSERLTRPATSAITRKRNSRYRFRSSYRLRPYLLLVLLMLSFYAATVYRPGLFNRLTDDLVSGDLVSKLDTVMDRVLLGDKSPSAPAGMEPQQEPEPEREQNRQLLELLAAAEQDIAAGRLYEPAGENALEKFNRVLQLDPESQVAVAGRRRVIDNLLQQASDALAKGSVEQAGRYLDQVDGIEADLAESRMVRVQVQEEQLRQERLKLAEEKKQLEQQRRARKQQDEEKRRQLELEEQRQKQQQRQRELQLALEQEEEQARKQQQEDTRIAEERRTQQLEQIARYNRHLSEARQALAENRFDMAITSFEESLRIQPESEEARSGILLAQERKKICMQVLGEWLWFNGGLITFNADGSVDGKHPVLPGNHGTWSCSDPGQRRFVIRWRDGGWINQLQLSTDGNRLDGSNQEGTRVSGRRRE